MRLEIIIPDNTRPDLKARFVSLTERLTAKPELIEDIYIEDDEAIQRMFTPERLAHIDKAAAEVKAGNALTPAQVREHFARKESAWMESQRD